MKREQLEGKFIICKTREEADFISYWIKELFDYDIGRFSVPKTIRIKPLPDFPEDKFGHCYPGYYNKNSIYYGLEKEEECSVLFGNLLKRWLHENRTKNGNSLPR